PLEFSFSDQTAMGILGIGEEKIRINNPTGNSTWTLSLATTDGGGALWADGGNFYDFNDPETNAEDGTDDDSFGGQMTIDPSEADINPEDGCGLTNISLGSSASFEEDVLDSITIASATSGADTGCFWDITNIDISQTIPAEQPAGNYSLEMVLTI